jgi:hypothetical protein
MSRRGWWPIHPARKTPSGAEPGSPVFAVHARADSSGKAGPAGRGQLGSSLGSPPRPRRAPATGSMGNRTPAAWVAVRRDDLLRMVIAKVNRCLHKVDQGSAAGDGRTLLQRPAAVRRRRGPARRSAGLAALARTAQCHLARLRRGHDGACCRVGPGLSAARQAVAGAHRCQHRHLTPGARPSRA